MLDIRGLCLSHANENNFCNYAKQGVNVGEYLFHWVHFSSFTYKKHQQEMHF